MKIIINNNYNESKEVNIMPGGDRTGPLGFGPMSGRGVGYCAGYLTPGYANLWGGRFGAGFGRGWGRGFGRGRGFRRAAFLGYPPYPAYSVAPPAYPYYYSYPYQGVMDSKQEMDLLQAEAEDIKAELEVVNKRIAELKKETKE